MSAWSGFEEIGQHRSGDRFIFRGRFVSLDSREAILDLLLQEVRIARPISRIFREHRREKLPNRRRQIGRVIQRRAGFYRLPFEQIPKRAA